MTTRLPDCLRAALLLAGLGLAASPRAAAQTQAVLTAQTCTELRQADAELNRLYQQVLKLYAQRPTFLVPFKASQVAWLRFRDAQAEALYPAAAADGPAHGLGLRLTREFIAKLGGTLAAESVPGRGSVFTVMV